MGLDAGARLGPYEVQGLLGAGGMGEVYRARDPRLNRDVAIKVLPGAVAIDADRLERFQREARAAGALNHPNVLAVFDVGAEAGVPYVVSELLEGETLRERLRTGGLPLQRAIQCGNQIAQGLAAAHEKGIVHRDLKPENLFLTKDGRVKILDFGLAKLREVERSVGDEEEPTVSQTDAGTVLGTVGYMSPEQARGLPADARSDIFSFGAVLYEMLAQRRAFQGKSAADTLAAILKEDPPELARSERPVPPGLELIVRRCLEKDPNHRFRSAHDLAFALEALSGISPSRPAAGAAPPARRRSLLGPLTMLATLALAGAAFLAVRRSTEPVLPSFQRLTFRRGAVMSARYAPDGQTVVYAASWDGDPLLRLFSTRLESPESTRLDLPEAGLSGVSRTGELALTLQHPFSGFGPAGTLARVPLAGGTPRAVLDGVREADWSPDGNMFAVVRDVAGPSRLEFPIGKALYEDDRIWDPRVSPDGARVAFWHGAGADGMAASLAVVDRAGNKTELSGGWHWANGLTWAPAGNAVWFTARKAGMTQELFAVALSGKTRSVLRLPSWSVVHDIAPDGRVLLTHGTFRIATTCLPPGADRERDMSWFGATRMLDLSADGKRLLFSEEGAGEQGALYVMNTTEKAAPIRLGEVAFGAALSPDGRWAAVKAQQQVILLPTGAGEPRKLSLSGVTPVYIKWFRDGKRCVLIGVEPGHLWRTYSLDIEDGRLQPLTPEGLISVWPSPDGRELLCTDHWGKWTVFSLERGESRPAPGLKVGEDVLDWATDGAAYICPAAPERSDVYRLDLRTGRRTLWRRIAIADPAGLLRGGPEFIFVAPQAGAYCYSTWWNLLDLYEVKGLK